LRALAAVAGDGEENRGAGKGVAVADRADQLRGAHFRNDRGEDDEPRRIALDGAQRLLAVLREERRERLSGQSLPHPAGIARRVPGAAPDGDAPQGNGNGMPQQGNDQQFGGGGGGRRRRRSRRRRPGGGGGGGAYAPETPLPIDLPAGETMPVGGVLWVKPNGTGLLVQPANNYVPQQTDAIVPRSVVEKLHLQQGLTLSGSARRAGNNLELVALEQIEGMPMEEYRESRRPFSELISIDPNQMFKLETEPERLTTRVLDLLSPLGKGQRCLIVAPPKAGKTTLLKDIAHGINLNHPDVTVMVLLVDERPE